MASHANPVNWFNIPIPEPSTKRREIRLCAKWTATVAGMASGDGTIPPRFRRAMTNRSMAFSAHAGSVVSGGTGRTGATKDQC